MMDCGACGARNRPGRRFCGGCGAPLAAACPACGFANEPDERFCGGCGQSLVVISPASGEAAHGARTAASDPSSPAAYTPRHLAEKILASRDALQGERKQVTVLFADVVGSTELIRDLDTEEAQRLLDGAVQVMMDAVHRYEGTVSRLTGDGLMALFGAPLAHEDHAVRACYAALAMQDAVRRHAERVRREAGAVLTIRTGLSAGEVVVRAIRDDLHMDFTAMGQTVHLAARMEQLATPGSTTLTSQTLALVEGYVQVRSLGPLPVKGLPEPIEVFELLGAGQARTRLQVAAARGLTRFVGRDAEMVALRAAMARVGDGQGQVAALVGEPGVGKSRLVWEVTHSHRIEGWLVLEAGSVSYGKATSYLPVIDLLKAYCRIEARDDERAIREKVIGKLLNLDEGLRPSLPAFLALLDAGADDPGWDALDPAQRRRQTLEALKRLLLRESREQPLLLVFEDLHWIDSETQALLDGLVESLPTAHILLLITYRPEYRHAWGNRGYYTQLRIDPLGTESAGELLASLLGDDPSTRALASLLIERTQGNPFFLEESVRMLVEQGALIGERGAYRLTGRAAGASMPPTVQAILASRIDRLAPDHKRLLQAAAVVGKDVPLDLLQAIAGESEPELQRGLAQLQLAEFLYEVSLFPEPEYTFKHALTHEVTYGSLLQDRRKALHAALVSAIERLHAGRLDERVERLAHHAFRGEAWEAAARYRYQAGQKAAGRCAYREALLSLEQALAALDHLPSTRKWLEHRFDVLLALRIATQEIGDRARSLDHARDAIAVATELDDPGRLGVALVVPTANLVGRGQHAEASEMLDRALAIAEMRGDGLLKTHVSESLGRSYLFTGAYRRGIEILTTASSLDAFAAPFEAYQRVGSSTYPPAVVQALLARCLSEVGEFEGALRACVEAIRLAHASNHSRTIAIVGTQVARAYLLRGEIADAIASSRRSLIPDEELSVQLGIGGSASLVLAYALAHEVEESARRLRGLLDRASPGTTMMLFPWIDVAEATILVGWTDVAHGLTHTLLDLARARRERGHEARLLWLLAQIESSSASLNMQAAEGSYHKALRLAEELGMRPLQAHCRLGLGKLYRSTSRLDEARAELATAAAMLSEMGMAFWLPEAERELSAVERAE